LLDLELEFKSRLLGIPLIRYQFQSAHGSGLATQVPVSGQTAWSVEHRLQDGRMSSAGAASFRDLAAVGMVTGIGEGRRGIGSGTKLFPQPQIASRNRIKIRGKYA
jgi:hypothetical protein